jgi:hypothetical protein
MLDDNRTAMAKYGIKMTFGLMFMLPFAMRFVRTGGYKSTTTNSLKKEVFQKLKIKK